MCNKIAHKTTWGAAQQIISLQKSGKLKKSKKMGGYWCDECQAYHITGNKKKFRIFVTN